MPFHLPKGQRRTAVVAGLVGNVMEWYDFALYGFVASSLSTLFFPSGSRTASLLATYGIFAAGFVMRPLGSALFGWMGDTVGRTKTMLVSVIMMSIPTVALGLLPTFDTGGIWAPIGLVTVRLIQGLSVGGEFSSSVTYLVETAPKGTRGLSESWANVGSMSGMLLGSGAATILNAAYSHDVILAWAWRLPFLGAAVLGSTAILLRRGLSDSEHFQRHAGKHEDESPLRKAMSKNVEETVQGVLFASAYGVVFYVSLVYIPTWINEYVAARGAANLADAYNTVEIVVVTLLLPFAGLLSDRVVRRTRFLQVVFLSEALLALPLFFGSLRAGLWRRPRPRFSWASS